MDLGNYGIGGNEVKIDASEDRSGKLVIGVKHRRSDTTDIGVIFAVVIAPALAANTRQFLVEPLWMGNGGGCHLLPDQLFDNTFLYSCRLPGKQAFTYSGAIKRKAFSFMGTHADSG